MHAGTRQQERGIYIKSAEQTLPFHSVRKQTGGCLGSWGAGAGMTKDRRNFGGDEYLCYHGEGHTGIDMPKPTTWYSLDKWSLLYVNYVSAKVFLIIEPKLNSSA